MKAFDYYNKLTHGTGEIAEEFVIATVCERYGWTWQEYQDQPIAFIRAIIKKMEVEAEVADRSRQADYPR